MMVLLLVGGSDLNELSVLIKEVLQFGRAQAEKVSLEVHCYSEKGPCNKAQAQYCSTGVVTDSLQCADFRNGKIGFLLTSSSCSSASQPKFLSSHLLLSTINALKAKK